MSCPDYSPLCLRQLPDEVKAQLAEAPTFSFYQTDGAFFLLNTFSKYFNVDKNSCCICKKKLYLLLLFV